MSTLLLHEVGLRDGLQAEAGVVPTETKLRWIRTLAASGLDLVQVGSFVRAEAVPQMADTDELFRLLATEALSTKFSALVLNEKGLERALQAGVAMVCLGISASDTHSRKNTGMGTEEALTRILATALKAKAAGCRVQVSIQSAFGCGFEGAVPEDRVLRLAHAYADAGLTAISLADTAGHGHPAQVCRLIEGLLAQSPQAEVTAHFHDTYGLGMANAYAALEAGAHCLESSFGGLGGCPFTKLAAGNIATEDLVHGLQREGLRRDVDLTALVALAREASALLGRELPGRVHRTGPVGY